MLTSFSLSLVSNIISSFIVFIISFLTEYSELLEAILTYVKYKDKFEYNIIRLVKIIRIKLAIFYTLEIISIIAMTYYLFVFCAVYRYSQSSIMINYIIGTVTSLAYSAGLTLVIALLRIYSINNHSNRLFNTSKFLYDKF